MLRFVGPGWGLASESRPTDKGREMKLGLREWWAIKSGGDRIVWAIVVLSLVLYFTGYLDA